MLPHKNPSRTKQQAWQKCKGNWQASSSSAWMLANSPHLMATPPHTNNVLPPVAATNVLGEVVSAVVTVAEVFCNNQPCYRQRRRSTAIHLSLYPLQAIWEMELLPHPLQQYQQCPHLCNVWKPRTNAQPQCKLRQHHGWIGCRNAQDNLTLGIQPHSSAKLSPPTAAAQAATLNARHYLAASNPSCAVWWNAYGRRKIPQAYHHGHASLSARPGHDELCWPKPCRCWAHTNDADDAARPTAYIDAHDDALLCPLSAELLTSRGWTR